MSCPRGSNINPVRIQSNSRRKCARRSIMVAPSRRGPPPATSRTGLPQVCPSIQKKEWRAILTSLILILKTLRTERCEIDRRSLPQNEVADQAPGRRRLGEAEMTMTEGIEDISRAAGAADHRQGIRQRRPVAHPLPAAFRLQARKEPFCLVEHGPGTGIVGRPPQSAKLHGAADPQAGLQRRDHEAMA